MKRKPSGKGLSGNYFISLKRIHEIKKMLEALNSQKKRKDKNETKTI